MLFGTVEYWRCHRHTGSQVFCQVDDFFIAEGSQIFFSRNIASFVVNFFKEFTDIGVSFLLFQHRIDFHAQTFCSHTQVHFQHLTHVHT